MELFHPVQGGAERGFDFGEAFLPAPKPNRVYVGVSDQKHFVIHKKAHLTSRVDSHIF